MKIIGKFARLLSDESGHRVSDCYGSTNPALMVILFFGYLSVDFDGPQGDLDQVAEQIRGDAEVEVAACN